ncbi:hypothetical protein [Halosimplex salinum]|uniref:hypothetical protein n=1 Tax=Halosimplex salinum TaxID=1710538 RepID=UPI000F4859A1|nr:hypothetical protein [Halosimplex salinum]
MSDDTFESELRDAFEDKFGADGDTAAAAAEKATAFREDYDEHLTAQDVFDRLESREGEFEHRYDFAIGDLAAATEDCTDSREYRLAGFDEKAADPDVGS